MDIAWLIRFITYAFNAYEWALIAYVLSSWLPMLSGTFIVKFLGDICEPYLGLFRKIIPPFGIMDISPILALITLQFLKIGILKVILFIV